MKISIILSSFKRPKLLDMGLWSLAKQHTNHDVEIIVINDGIHDETEKVCERYFISLNIKYIFTGKRNLKGQIKFRSPSFALNIGIKHATGDIIILTSPEIFHLNNAIDLIVEPLIKNKKILSTPRHISFDNTGETKNYLSKTLTALLPDNIMSTLESNTHRCKYASKLPFFLGLYKKEILDIGGYDEDFTGWACDDDDLVERLVANGLTYNYVDAKIIHLFHGKQYDRAGKAKNKEYLHNLSLYRKRKGIILRNQNRPWGVLDES